MYTCFIISKMMWGSNYIKTGLRNSTIVILQVRLVGLMRFKDDLNALSFQKYVGLKFIKTGLRRSTFVCCLSPNLLCRTKSLCKNPWMGCRELLLPLKLLIWRASTTGKKGKVQLHIFCRCQDIMRQLYFEHC